MDREQKHLTQSEAEGALAEWQRILRLQDWQIKIKVGRGNGIDLPESLQGRCTWTLKRREALISLLDPIDWDPAISYPQDMEATLVHELLHLHLAPIDTFKDNSAEETALEQAIIAVSFALVNLKRHHPQETKKD